MKSDLRQADRQAVDAYSGKRGWWRMARKPIEIKTVSYVHSADGGLIPFDDLTPEQKQKAATQLKLTFLNELFRGRAEFFITEESQT